MKKIKIASTLIGFLCLMILILGQTQIGNLYNNSDLEDANFVEIEGNIIRYVQEGFGDDILLIHGTPGSIEDWRTLSKTLTQNYRVTLFDRLGHGFSTNNDYAYSIKDNAQLVEQLIRKLELKSPMIVGHSYGGSTVAHLLANHYNDDLNYMIIDSPLYTYEVSSTYKLLSTPILGKAFGLIANYTIAEGQMEAGIRSSLKNQTASTLTELIKERKAIWLQPKVLHSKAQESVNYHENLKAISDKYATISANVIVVTGANETGTFKSQAQQFSKEVPTDNLIILSNTGHYIQLDQKDTIVNLIKKTMG